MNKGGLIQFLVAANKAGYAGGDEKKWIKEGDGSTTIGFEQGDWRSHDNYFGGEPYGGRMVVFYQGKPYWMMVYYGWVEEGVEATPIYGVLKNALMRMPKDHPYRGDREYQEGGYTYTNNWKGEVERFEGAEEIKQGEKLVYKAKYMGGMVDERRGEEADE